jgi:hypothetical protein
MRAILFAFLFLIIVPGPHIYAGEDRATALMLSLKNVSTSGQLTVEILNRQRTPLRVWEDSNSWGAARWRLLCLRKGVLESYYQNPKQSFLFNEPSFHEVKAGGHVEQELNLNAGDWCGTSHCTAGKDRGVDGRMISFEPGDFIIVIYDVPFTPENLRLDVWYGVAVASLKIPG